MNKEIELYEGELRELRERVKELEARLNISKKYFIKENYVHREKVRYHDDTKKSYNSDMWQKEVYVLAKEYAKEREHIRILDIGTGSGFKLLKYFDDFDTIGMDLPSTVEWLKKKYPNKSWTDNFEPITDMHMIIASDVIEHIDDPDNLLDLIEASNPELIVLSTPDRNLLEKGQDGPPRNTAHFREWSFDEFGKYIESRFNVIEHLITNEKQGTQTIVCEIKND